jgi:aryl-alcohol dehydrogenase-like predicted oxidoreductase
MIRPAPVAIAELGAVGFGGYRIGLRDPAHRRALRLALRSGCSLIDTAPNYEGGDSERLVGQALRAEPTRGAFVITKVGYVGPADAHFFESAPDAAAAIVVRADASPYCLHPDFIRHSVARSRDRLGVATIDGVLLHNPEHLFTDRSVDRTAVRQLAAALETLEELSERQMVRFYGVSSNRLMDPTVPFDLATLASLAQGVARFRFVQTPLSLFDLDPNHPATLADQVRQLGLRLIVNRPLNAAHAGRVVRLADDAAPAPRPSPRMLAHSVEHLRSILDRELGALGIAVAHLPFLADLVPTLQRFATTDAVEQFFGATIDPLCAKLGRFTGTADATLAADAAKAQAMRFARAATAIAAAAARRDLIARRVIDALDTRPLQIIALERLLSAGADHVLIGMKRVAYVRQMRPFLAVHASGSADRA